MARFGKGKPMDVQARLYLQKRLDLHSRHAEKKAKNVRGSRTTGKIHSLRTFNNYCASLAAAGDWLRQEHGLRHLSDMTPEQGQTYLERRAADGISQRQLDTDRTTLQFVTGEGSLDRLVLPDAGDSPLPGRSYTPEQVHLVAASQSDRNSLSTLIAHQSGLRAHELLTLQRSDEGSPSPHRTWRSDRFEGRNGVRYLVDGKGGLRREVLIPAALAERLETVRRDPVTVVDRGIRYQSAYDIGGGNAWSRSFTDASKRALGWTTGGHGVRHSYAQERMRELQQRGHSYLTARNIVSQELGHFRGDVVEIYLR